MALTDYDKKNLSSSDQKKIQAATDKWNAANAKGDKAGMASAAAEAAAVRNSAGYKTDSSGNYSGSYSAPTTTAGGGSVAKNNPYASYTPVGTYNDAGLPSSALNQINNFKTQYNNAIASGDTAAATAAHNAAEYIRKQYGYSGGGDGSDYIALQNEIYLPAQSSSPFVYSAPQPTYSGNYDSRINELLNQILNRDDFSYDVESDPLYQQYAQMYQREGDRAMRETMAEAAASAGGMNSYAITAAQQANNYYGAQLNDKIPELYQLAYEMYLADKESKIQDLGILQNLDATQYNRYRDTMTDWQNDRNFAYDMYRDDIADSQWNKTFDYNAFVDNRNFAYDSDWQNKQWDYNVEQDTVADNRYDKETAKEEVWKLIEMGISPSADLVTKAGMNETDVALAVAAVQAEKNPSISGGKSSTYKSGYSGDDDDDDEGDMSDYTTTNISGDSWVHVPELGRLSYQELFKMVEKGTVIENVDNQNKKISYRKA